MIQLEIDNNEFNIVNSYNELSLGQYIDIIKIGDSRFNVDAIEADMEIIASLSDRPEELKKLLWSFTGDDFDALRNEFEWVKTEAHILDDFKKVEPKKSLTIDGKEFGIISNHNKMSLGEVVSFETLMKQKDSDFHRLEIAFGILLRPIENGKLVEFTEDIFLSVIKNKYKINMVDMYATLSFFLSGDKTSITENTKRFSIRRN